MVKNGIYSGVNTGEPKTSFFPMILCSVAFHVFIFIIIPIATKLFRHTETYKRPKTFQLVNVKRYPERVKREKKIEEIDKKEPVKKKTEKKVEKKTVKKSVSEKKKTVKRDVKPESEKTEDLGELEELLGGMPEPVSNINFKNAFPYSWYERNIMMKVERHWKPAIRDEDLYVVVSFSIKINGSISDVSITRSSGNRVLDNLALRAVKLAAPFGKLPPGYSGSELNINYTLRPTTQEK